MAVEPNFKAIIGDLYCKLVVKEQEAAASAEFIKQFEAEADKRFTAMEVELKKLKEPATEPHEESA